MVPRGTVRGTTCILVRPMKAGERAGKPAPTRDELHSSAGVWRRLQGIGMRLHSLPSPRPPTPAFVRTIPSTLATTPGEFVLEFYLPKAYAKPPDDTRWPVVVNFHGGGFTIGKGSDDARFARFVLKESQAVFVAVNYRLAPEHPFATAVDDGADALLYLANNADELRIDENRIATSGFSAGGNIAITAPLRLAQLRRSGAPLPHHNIVALATWYPITDYTLSRAERRAASTCPEQCLLSPALTSLFDSSYIFPSEVDLADPCLSPSKASDDLLVEGLPPVVLFYTCEYDMLLREGRDLANRLERPPISKRVVYNMILGVQHAWDKGPNPLKKPKKSEKLYAECCGRLRAVFRGEELEPDRPRRVWERWKQAQSPAG